jgi:hypothetical protein
MLADAAVDGRSASDAAYRLDVRDALLAPVGLLFHPPFVQEIMLPFLRAMER